MKPSIWLHFYISQIVHRIGIYKCIYNCYYNIKQGRYKKGDKHEGFKNIHFK